MNLLVVDRYLIFQKVHFRIEKIGLVLAQFEFGIGISELRRQSIGLGSGSLCLLVESLGDLDKLTDFIVPKFETDVQICESFILFI